jgi:phosphoribosylaminoimidazole-succinocarboxamide synthase
LIQRSIGGRQSAENVTRWGLMCGNNNNREEEEMEEMEEMEKIRAKYEEDYRRRLETILEKAKEILKESGSKKAVFKYECGSERFNLILMDES